jgi:IS6 family transposase
LNGLKDREKPSVINTDKAPTYAAALVELKKEGRCPQETRHRQVKYLNNVIEADRGKLKQLIWPVRGSKTLKTAYATIKGFEVMRALRKGQPSAFNVTRDIPGEAGIVERAFGLRNTRQGTSGSRSDRPDPIIGPGSPGASCGP